MGVLKCMMKQILHEIAKNSTELKKKMTDLQEEIIDVKKGMVTNEKRWNEEKQMLLQRIAPIKNKTEHLEKQRSRN